MLVLSLESSTVDHWFGELAPWVKKLVNVDPQNWCEVLGSGAGRQ